MKHAKTIGLLSVAATALMGLVGTASATELTSPPGTKLGPGTVIQAESEGALTFDGTINISCNNSAFKGEVSNAGGEAATVSIALNSITFTNCGNHTVTLTSLGTLVIHRIGFNTSTVTSTGLRITKLTHSLFLGTRHCVDETNNTDLGTLTGRLHDWNLLPKVHLGQPIPPGPTDSLCGSDSELTGNYIVTTPESLTID